MIICHTHEDSQMSRTLFAFLLSELKTVRILCKHDGCGVVTELPMGKLAQKFHADGMSRVICPHCRGTLTDRVISHGSVFGTLTAVAAEAQQANAKFDIEFILPDSPDR